jgi:hypothetical protein
MTLRPPRPGAAGGGGRKAINCCKGIEKLIVKVLP